MQPAPTIQGRRRTRGRILALTGLLAVSALVAVPPLAATAATPYGTNLVKNAGAEKGLADWELFADARTAKYGGAGLGFPSKAKGNAIGGGVRFFHAGQYDSGLGTCGDFQQTISLKGIGSAIDAGNVKVRFRGYAGTNGAADINAHIDLYFRDAENHPVASNGITRTASSTNESYRAYDVTKRLSGHTRKLRVHLWADGESTIDGSCQAFWDKLSVVLIRT